MCQGPFWKPNERKLNQGLFFLFHMKFFIQWFVPENHKRKLIAPNALLIRNSLKTPLTGFSFHIRRIWMRGYNWVNRGGHAYTP